MSSHRTPPSLRLYRFAFRAASSRLPAARRADWVAEWTTELWYVAHALQRQNAADFFESHFQIFRFCCGAISDLRCLLQVQPARSRSSRSAVTCVLLLTCMAACSSLLALSLDGVRHALRPSLFANATDVVAIAPAGLSEVPLPLVRLRTLHAWQRRSQHLFSHFAFFLPVTQSVHIGPHNAPELTLGWASPDLFSLLKVPISYAQADHHQPAIPVLLLSEATWKARFHSDPEIIGQTLRVGLKSVQIGGVVPDDATPLGSHLDGWLLLPASAATSLPESTRVFLLARKDPQLRLDQSEADFWHMSVPGTYQHADFDCTALSVGHTSVAVLFVWVLLLAVLSLPALSPLSSSEHKQHRATLSTRLSGSRWAFLTFKILAALGTCFSLSLAVSYGLPWSDPVRSIYLFLVSSFAASLFALHWCMRDQAERCPVCLGKLRCPARVGQPSRNFLSWNGTELLCTGGHGLLHVPEIPTSWFSEPRWLSLDPSWDGLFLQGA